MVDKEFHEYIESEDIVTRDIEPDIKSGGTPKGMDHGGFARQVIKTAESKGIQIRSFPDLTNMLFRLELDDTIPQEISDIVGELLTWVLELNNIWELERRRHAEHSSDI
ncbi:hypothetical protein AMJ86_05630 [bacterium SM23_57]|nr:MAG: hypothetical protein AMJ86_05630 [bacterium SM23_57]